MEKYYGQHGEDFLMDQVFKGKKDGFFVEVGALDGIKFSNTYIFEKKGWSGICIEAHKDFIDSLTKNRPRSQIVHCAAGEKDQGEITFYTTKFGSLSTVDKTEEIRWQKDFKNDFEGFEEQHVKMKTLTTIFDELNVTNIDFISLDIEGYEVQALQGLDLSKYRPRIFIIEYKNQSHKKALESLLFPFNYKYLGKMGCNIFYSTESKDKKIISKNYGKRKLIIFEDGEEIENEILLSMPTVWTNIKHKLSAFKRSFIKSSKSYIPF